MFIASINGNIARKKSKFKAVKCIVNGFLQFYEAVLESIEAYGYNPAL